MPYYEIRVTAERYVCVKADNEDDACQTAQEECGIEWSKTDAEIEDEYGDGTDPEHKRWIASYKRDDAYYETEYNEDVPPAS